MTPQEIDKEFKEIFNGEEKWIVEEFDEIIFNLWAGVQLREDEKIHVLRLYETKLKSFLISSLASYKKSLQSELVKKLEEMEKDKNKFKRPLIQKINKAKNEGKEKGMAGFNRVLSKFERDANAYNKALSEAITLINNS